MTMNIGASNQVWRTTGLALSQLGGCALGVFLANFYGMSSEYSSVAMGVGVFIVLASIWLSGLISAIAVVVGPLVFGVGAAWAFGPAGLSPIVFVIGMVMAMAGFILRIFNDY
uniref:Uncharacterized protein n=1 Tax=Pseudomonas syringae TaxID=317 RepID=I3W2F9_PSESX|nr:hypothetical protein [Pseudomonas syringae]AFK89786.1 hypothetical protein [Pseudomonas syringae]